MQAITVFLVVGFLTLVVIFPLWAVMRIRSLGAANKALEKKHRQFGEEINELRSRVVALGNRPTAATPTPPPLPVVIPAVTAALQTPPAPVVAPAELVATAAPIVPPIEASPVRASAPATPPVLPLSSAPPPIARAAAPPDEPKGPRVNWEQFMGAKLFAWLGGLAGLLAVGFFVKYSFEHDLIPPAVRVAIGFLFALGLVFGGLRIDRSRYAITAQTLIATGVVSLYTVTFACRSVYYFAFFGPGPTLLLMSLITAAAFLLAVRLEAQVVAVLGLLGGFLTPVLVSSGQDNPLGLFGYIALLDLGLVAVALHRRWRYLVPLGALGTIVTQVGWAGNFFSAAKADTAVGVCLGFCVLFLATYLVAGRLGRAAREITWSAIALPFVALGFAFMFLGQAEIAARPGLLFTYVLLADACLLVVAWCDDEWPQLHLVAGTVVFVLLAVWTGSRLTAPLLPWALAFYLLHAVLHTAFPLLLQRHRPEAAPTWWSQFFPPMALLLMLLPLIRLEAVSLLFWPCVLLVDLLAIGLALLTASLAAVGAVLVLTLIATGVWIFQIPVAASAPAALLLVVGGFAVLFFAAGLFLARRFGDRLAAAAKAVPALAALGDPRAQIPAFSALLPFLLLILLTSRLALADPSPVFGLALLLVVLVLGLARLFEIDWLPACALAGLAGLEYSWQHRQAAADGAMVPLVWYLVFLAIFAAYPFVFRRRLAARTGPWAVAALGGVVQFPLVHRLVTTAWPGEFPGVMPVLFAVPPLVSLIAILRGATADARARLNQLAWFGGVALLFLTLVFPIQWDRQWLTLGWALEGVALLWLFHRVPHPGLRGVGAGLLVTAFVRLALNPAVFAYHPRSDTAIFNWYLYSFGVVTLCLFAAARLAVGPESGPGDGRRILGVNAPVLFVTLGTVLAFLLLNIEIADFFSQPGQRVLTFKFSGHFGRDMTYTIAWALFALGLLLAGIWKRARAGRYAALALLGAAVIKLFFHDLARLDALYRIGALLAVAVIATIASFAYQRYLPADEDETPSK